MKKLIFRLLALFLAALMIFTVGCGNAADQKDAVESTAKDKQSGSKPDYTPVELAKRGESTILSAGGYAVTGDFAFLLDDGYENVSFSRSGSYDDEGLPSDRVSFTAKKSLDGGTITIHGSVFLGQEADYMEDSSVTMKELAELRLSSYSEGASLAEGSKGDFKLWSGAASSSEADENGCQFYAFCAEGPVNDLSFFFSLNGATSECTDDQAALEELTNISTELWDSLKIAQGENIADSLYGSDQVSYLPACKKTVSGKLFDIASMPEFSLTLDGGDNSGRIRFEGNRELSGEELYLNGSLEVYAQQEEFEKAKEYCLAELETMGDLSSETAKSGQNIDWSVSAVQDTSAFLATAEEDGVYLLCRMMVGSEKEETEKAAFANCEDWLLSLELR